MEKIIAYSENVRQFFARVWSNIITKVSLMLVVAFTTILLVGATAPQHLLPSARTDQLMHLINTNQTHQLYYTLDAARGDIRYFYANNLDSLEEPQQNEIEAWLQKVDRVLPDIHDRLDRDAETTEEDLIYYKDILTYKTQKNNQTTERFISINDVSYNHFYVFSSFGFFVSVLLIVAEILAGLGIMLLINKSMIKKE